MTLAQIKQDQQYSHRTQVSLSRSMYQQLLQDKGERSLAEYLRQIVIWYWEHEQHCAMHQRRNLLQVKTILNQPLAATPVSITNAVVWQKQLRQDKGR